MLVIVVTIFGLCWLPLHVFTLVIDFRPEVLEYDTQEDEKLLLGIYLGVHWLAMSNSFANPIIYSFTNDNFRVGLSTNDLIMTLNVCDETITLFLLPFLFIKHQVFIIHVSGFLQIFLGDLSIM